MPDRADHMAKTLLSRCQTLERHLREDGLLSDSAQANERRLSIIGKVLATEVGVADGTVDRLVLALMPSVRPGHDVAESERREFAQALRARLPLSNAQS